MKMFSFISRAFVPVALLCTGGCFSTVSSMTPGKMEWVQSQSDAPRAGNVYLIRGLIGLFSGGIDTLTVKVNDAGVRAHVFQEDQKVTMAKVFADVYRKAPQHEPIVLIGHSLGADDAIYIARELDKYDIPVDMLITIDATRPPNVPKNVKICYNYYQPSILDGTGILRGIPLVTDAGFTGKLYNMNVRKEYKDLLEWDTNHVNIDKNTKIHADVIAKLKDVCIPREQWTLAHPGAMLRVATTHPMPESSQVNGGNPKQQSVGGGGSLMASPGMGR